MVANRLAKTHSITPQLMRAITENMRAERRAFQLQKKELEEGFRQQREGFQGQIDALKAELQASRLSSALASKVQPLQRLLAELGETAYSSGYASGGGAAAAKVVVPPEETLRDHMTPALMVCQEELDKSKLMCKKAVTKAYQEFKGSQGRGSAYSSSAGKRKRRDKGSGFDWTQCRSEVCCPIPCPPPPHAVSCDFLASGVCFDPRRPPLLLCTTPQGGSMNCALCSDVEGGALPCGKVKGKTSSNCRDDKIMETKKFFRAGQSGKGACFRLTGDPQDHHDGALDPFAFTTRKFPTLKNFDSQKSVVLTKAWVTHPHKASKKVGVVMFKRLVTHTCTGHNPAFCTKGATVADVYKVGYCVKCQTAVFPQTWAQATTQGHRIKFVNKCIPNNWAATALDKEGNIKKKFRCTGKDWEHARASITGF